MNRRSSSSKPPRPRVPVRKLLALLSNAAVAGAAIVGAVIVIGHVKNVTAPRPPTATTPVARVVGQHKPGTGRRRRRHRGPLPLTPPGVYGPAVISPHLDTPTSSRSQTSGSRVPSTSGGNFSVPSTGQKNFSVPSTGQKNFSIPTVTR